MNSTTRWRNAAMLFGLLHHSPAHAAEIDRIYRSPQYLGRGDTGVSRSEGYESLFYNPANLANTGKDGSFFKKAVILSPSFDVSKNTYTLGQKVKGDDSEKLAALKDFEGKPAHIGVSNFIGAEFEDFAVGLITSVRGNILVFKNPYAAGVETFDVRMTQDNGLVGGYGYSFFDHALTVGATAKLLQRTQTTVDLGLGSADALSNFKIANYQNKGVGVGSDIGMTYSLPPQYSGIFAPKVALVIQDLGDTAFKGSKQNGVHVPLQRQSVNFGTSIAFAAPGGQATAQLDFLDITSKTQSKSFFKKTHVGTDYALDSWFGVGAGLNQGYPTTGIYFNLKYARIDLASYGEEVGETVGDKPDQRYVLRLVSQI